MLSVARHTRCMRYYTLKEEGLFSTRRMTILEFAVYNIILLLQLWIPNVRHMYVYTYKYMHLMNLNWLHWNWNKRRDQNTVKNINSIPPNCWSLIIIILWKLGAQFIPDKKAWYQCYMSNLFNTADLDLVWMEKAKSCWNFLPGLDVKKH